MRSRYIWPLLALLALNACLKNNGDPYPGSKSDSSGDSSNTGGNIIGMEIFDQNVTCVSAGDNPVNVTLTPSSASTHIKMNVSRAEVVLHDTFVAEFPSDAYRIYDNAAGGLNIPKIYISKTKVSGAFPATLKFINEEGDQEDADLNCNSTGYKDD